MKISVIVPSLNQVRYISRSISSVVEQKGDFDVELLVMDGGSTDGTVEVLKEVEKKLRQRPPSRLTFVWKSGKDRCQAQAANTGFSLSRGDVLALVNSDDACAPGAFQKVVAFFERNPGFKWLTGKCRIIDAKNREIRKAVTAYKNFLLRHYRYELLLVENFVSQPATFWRRSLYEELGGFDENRPHSLDYEYWLRLGEKYPPGILGDYLASFRIHPQSMTGRGERIGFGEGLELVGHYGRRAGFLLPFYALSYVKTAGAYRVLRWLGG